MDIDAQDYILKTHKLNRTFLSTVSRLQIYMNFVKLTILHIDQLSLIIVAVWITYSLINKSEWYVLSRRLDDNNVDECTKATVPISVQSCRSLKQVALFVHIVTEESILGEDSVKTICTQNYEYTNRVKYVRIPLWRHLRHQ